MKDLGNGNAGQTLHPATLLGRVVRRIMVHAITAADYILFFAGCFHTRPRLELWAYEHGWLDLTPGQEYFILMYRDQNPQRRRPNEKVS